MWLLIIGLALFLGVHSLHMLAPTWREGQIAKLGQGVWKGLFALVAAIGFVAIVWGFALERMHPVAFYLPPTGMRHLNALFTLLAFVFFAAAYVPRNHIKTWVGHPMLAGVTLWALGHLLATGWLRDFLLFGVFFVWAAADFAVSLVRLERADVTYPGGSLVGDVLTVLVGVAAWSVFAFWLHAHLIGVSPFA